MLLGVLLLLAGLGPVLPDDGCGSGADYEFWRCGDVCTLGEELNYQTSEGRNKYNYLFFLQNLKVCTSTYL